MWGSGFIDEEFGEISRSPAATRAAGRITDWLFEAGPGKEIGAYAWRNMKQGAKVAFNKDPEYDGGFVGLKPLLKGLNRAQRRPKLHLVGHSAGSIVLGYLLSALDRFAVTKLELGSIHLMAPACTVAFFRQHYAPYLTDNGALKLRDKIYLYDLTDRQELDDTVSSNIPLFPSYSRSLWYLVPRAYEDAPNTPLAGMQIHAGGMPANAKLAISYSAPGNGDTTASTTHGGFDNDVATMKTVMSHILGKKVPHPPVVDELKGY